MNIKHHVVRRAQRASSLDGLALKSGCSTFKQYEYQASCGSKSTKSVFARWSGLEEWGVPPSNSMNIKHHVVRRAQRTSSLDGLALKSGVFHLQTV